MHLYNQAQPHTFGQKRDIQGLHWQLGFRWFGVYLDLGYGLRFDCCRHGWLPPTWRYSSMHSLPAVTPAACGAWPRCGAVCVAAAALCKCTHKVL